MRDQTDAYLTAAFHNVPVPDGLAERLLDRLAAEVGEGNSRLPLDIAGRLVNLPVPPNRQVASCNRRWLLVGGGVLAVAAGFVVAAWLGAHRETPLSEQIVLDQAIQSFDMGSKDYRAPALGIAGPSGVSG